MPSNSTPACVATRTARRTGGHWPHSRVNWPPALSSVASMLLTGAAAMPGMDNGR